MPTLNINNSNAAVSVPSGYDAVLSPGALGDTITLGGTDTLHGGGDGNFNTIITNGNNMLNVINAAITDNGGDVDTINGVGAFNNISIDGVPYSGAVSLVYVNEASAVVFIPIDYSAVLAPNSNNNTIVLGGNDTLHGGGDLNSNIVNTYNDNTINVAGTTTVNENGGNTIISGKNITFNKITVTGNGDNTIYGGNGSVVIDNGTGNDRIYAQALNGEHSIFLGTGSDTVEVRDGVSGPNVPGNLDTVIIDNFVHGKDFVALNTEVGAGSINAGNLATITSDTFGYHGQYAELVLGGLSIIFHNVPSVTASDFILA